MAAELWSHPGVPSSGAEQGRNSPALRWEEDLLKLRADFGAVTEKVTLYCELIAAGVSRDDETVVTLVGFLDACAERLKEVIEAGTQGQLPEELFALCLKVNDVVLQTLDADKNGTIPTPAMLNAASITKPQAQASESLLDLDDDFATTLKVTPSHAPAKPAPHQAEAEGPASPSLNPLLAGQANLVAEGGGAAKRGGETPAFVQDDFDSFLASLSGAGKK